MNFRFSAKRTILLMQGALLLTGALIMVAFWLAERQKTEQPKHEETRAVAARAMTVSPDCERLAFVMVKKEGGKQSASLRAFANSSYRRIAPLTFECLEIVQSPDPDVVAFLAKEIGGTSRGHDDYNVYVINNKANHGSTAARNAIKTGAPYAVVSARDFRTVKRGLQFSQDGKYLRYQQTLLPKPEYTARIDSKNRKKERNSVIAKVARWIASDDEPSNQKVSEYEYAYVDIHGNYLGTKSGYSRWLPPKRPPKLPAFLSSPQPTIHAQAHPAWSPDSQTLYVHDHEGVWGARFTRYNGLPEWSLLMPMTQIRAFHISPIGDRILLEKESRAVVLANFKANGGARLVGEGRSAQFSPDGTRFAFLNENGAFAGGVKEGEAQRVEKRGAAPILLPNSRLQWSHDSRLLYAHDAQGIWTTPVDESGSGWTLMIKAEGIHTFRVLHNRIRPELVLKEGEKPKYSRWPNFYMEMEEMPTLFKADGAGGFVPMALQEGPDYGNGWSGSESPALFGIDSNLKERHLVRVMLSKSGYVPEYIGTGWGAGSVSSFEPFFKAWSYQANFSGLYSMRISGRGGVGRKIHYNDKAR